MVYKIRAIYRKTGNIVWVSTAKFKTKLEAKDYAKEVVGNRRFKSFQFVKIR